MPLIFRSKASNPGRIPQQINHRLGFHLMGAPVNIRVMVSIIYRSDNRVSAPLQFPPQTRVTSVIRILVDAGYRRHLEPEIGNSDCIRFKLR